MSRLDRILKKFRRRRVGTKGWSKYPPTREDVSRSHNGYFWIKEPLRIDGEVVDWLIEVVQIVYCMSEGETDTWDSSNPAEWPLTIGSSHGKWDSKYSRIEDPDTVRHFQEHGIEWQAIKRPDRLPKDLW